MIVRSELENMGLHPVAIQLGEVILEEDVDDVTYKQLKANLAEYGLDILEDKKSILIEKIKNVIVELVHYSEEPLTINFSDYLSEKLGYDYNYLSNLFSEVKGITIEQCLISHKIEKVKELLIYDELTLTEIANKLHYSSVAHLSNQFKKVTGLTPSFFKTLKDKRFNAREDL
jgi:AraC-like DNA-binding protein